MFRTTCTACILLALPARGQVAITPPSTGIPGITADERIDATDDGIADLLITTRVDRRPDPEQGLEGWYRRNIVTLSGTSILMGPTDYKGGFFTLADSAAIDTAELAQRFHFKQLTWTAPDQPVEFQMLERPFGPGVAKDADGWFGTGNYYEGTMILRSTVGGSTRIASFKVWLDVITDRAGITLLEAISVPVDFGKEGDPPPPKPKVNDPHSFGHDEGEPQVIIPPGIPPDVRMDLVGDETQDFVLTGHEEHWHGVNNPGYYVRGVAPSPGVAFLKIRGTTNDPWAIYRLPYGRRLTPDSLAMGLQNGTLMWASPEQGNVFVPVLRHPFGMPDEPQEWSLAEMQGEGDLVFRTSYYGHTTIIGVLEVRAYVPGGELQVQSQTWVEEGQVLEVR